VGEASADGVSAVPLQAFDKEGRLQDFRIGTVGSTRVVRVESGRLRTTTLPGTTTITLHASGFRPARATVQTAHATADRFDDGTPDFLRLDTVRDRDAFRTRFAVIADRQARRPRTQLPEEVDDCAALVRYAYREAFREREPVAIAPPGKWQFPFTALGANLFRVAAGRYSEGDLAANRFAEFADAQTLLRYNMHRVGRDMEQARPADLLFYRQRGQRLPFHVMVVLPRTPEDPEGAIVYHTGPTGGDPGEIRHRSVEALMTHPEPQWRPQPGNPNFLGIYRWNILKETRS
jgi:uncharacterized protein YfaT (DUF1175 family)